MLIQYFASSTSFFAIENLFENENERVSCKGSREGGGITLRGSMSIHPISISWLICMMLSTAKSRLQRQWGKTVRAGQTDDGVRADALIALKSFFLGV
jgi:hypothetical protein